MDVLFKLNHPAGELFYKDVTKMRQTQLLCVTCDHHLSNPYNEISKGSFSSTKDFEILKSFVCWAQKLMYAKLNYVEHNWHSYY